ncbi:unnamed protein product [Phytophthora fragariaefolia]|uniref:Unnamed protein product n=1 Tax=Phytophthora fragariaefolia TaxID=1490495 RepID=A0A9W6XIP3_9STRA|nr:unnamed protein product [Phytophthora fragariaefolia]
MGKSIKALTVTLRHIAVVATLSTIASVATLYAVALTTVFPVPFSMLLGSPPCIVVFGACFAYFWGAQVRDDPSVQVDMKREQAVSRCQVALTVVYPLYISGFVSLSGIYQTMFVAVLPLIKLVSRNWVAHALNGHDDLKPQAVTFIVEVFSALYVSNALSTSSSWMATAMIMTVDAVVVWQYTRDIAGALNDVKLLMRKIPQNHPVARDNFVQVAVRLIEAEGLLQTANLASSCLSPAYLAKVDEWVTSKSLMMKREATHASKNVNTPVSKRTRGSHRISSQSSSSKVYASSAFSSTTTAVQPAENGIATLENVFSQEERALFIHQTASALFITEFVILAEYVEVMLPIAYGWKSLLPKK